MMLAILILLSILAVTAELLMISSWLIGKRRFRKKQDNLYAPKTCVIVPCKFIEKNFKENIKAICQQEYEKYNVIFIVDSEEEPVYKELLTITKNIPYAQVKISSLIPGTSGKIAALITGVKNSDDAEVLVFADSDIKPHKTWLMNLVSNLNKEYLGATTGYRWYFPKNLKSLFLSAWNMTQSLSLFYETLNFCWGGSTAMKKSVFKRLNIEKKWIKGFSDDLILTKELRDNNLKIQFVPQSVCESQTDANLKQLITWGTQQLTWVKWYYTKPWLLSIIGMLGLKIITILGIFIFFFGYTLPALIMISTIFFEMISGAIAYSIYKEHMIYPKKKFGLMINYMLMMPIVFFVIAYNNLCSIFTFSITWGGRTYKKDDLKT